MSAKILDGKKLAGTLKEDLSRTVSELKSRTGQIPCIASIAVGDDPDAVWYIQSQKKAAQSVGIELHVIQAGPKDDLHRVIDQANQGKYHGIILNKPVPGGYSNFVNDIDPDKDIEGLGDVNIGRFFLGNPRAVIPCTPNAAMYLIRSAGIDLKGKEAVVIGRSEIVGKPMAVLLLGMNMTVTVCHSKTSDIASHVRRADVVVAVVGQKRFVKGDWIKPGAVVVDIGINDEDGKIVGDVDFVSVKEKAGYITPVPGGVGPITSLMLMSNVLQAFKAQVK